MVALEPPAAAAASANGPTDGAPKDGTKVTLPILSEVRSAQGAHGLKLGGDFLRYRQYCTRRLARVRSSTSTTNGRGRYSATPITPTIVASDARTLLVPLYLAERAWAYAMDVKREQKSGPARSRRTVVARLSKAVGHAKELRTLCAATADAETCLEAEAYARWMAATLALEKEEWTPALAEFEAAQQLYGGLAGSHSGTAAAGVFEDRGDEIAQAVRFCRYNIAREGGDAGNPDDLRGMLEAGGDDVLAEKVEAALAAARKRAAQSFGEVTWAGRAVPLRSEVVREAVLAATEEGAALAKMGGERVADDFDKLFIAYHDAGRVVQGEIAEFRAATAARAEERIAELEFLAAFLAHGRLTHTIVRNKLLVDAVASKKSARPDDFVRLYDNLVGNCTDILALAGVADDAQVASAIESQKALFSAQRCFHLARCYLAAGSHGAASQLFDRSAAYARPLAGGGGWKKEAEVVLQDAAGLRVRARAQLYLREAEATTKMGAMRLEDGARRTRTRTMCANLEAFESFSKDPAGVRRIAEIPPALEAVPCKPVLFDLAVDGVAFPGGEAAAEKAEGDVEMKEGAAAPEAAAAAAPAALGTRLGRWWSGTG